MYYNHAHDVKCLSEARISVESAWDILLHYYAEFSILVDLMVNFTTTCMAINSITCLILQNIAM